MKEIIALIINIAKVFNLGSDPIPTPFRTKQTARQADSIPDDVKHVHGRAFQTVQIDRDTIESSKWTDTGLTRTDQLTKADETIIQDRGLKMDKYAELKYLWSCYMTVTSAVREMKTRGYKRGYGVSTIEKYFAAMGVVHMENRHLSPTG